MIDLITVPTFTINQGSFMDMDDNVENPISVDFYHGVIILRQDGFYKQQEEIKILPSMLDKIFKEIKKHKVEAERHLSK